MKRCFATIKMWCMGCCLLGTMGSWLCANSPLEQNPYIFPAPEVPVEGMRVCTDCNEKGRVQSERQGIDTRKVAKGSRDMVKREKTRFMVYCKTCDGKKNYLRKLYPQERVEEWMKLRAAYDREHFAARHKQVGDVYADADYLDALPPEDFAKLAAQYPVKCKKCYGLAVVACSRCKGVGHTLKKVRSPEPKEEKIHCNACNGSGEAVCKTCSASGLARICTRCKGLGIQEKPARKNTPAMVVRCQSCNGMGRR